MVCTADCQPRGRGRSCARRRFRRRPATRVVVPLDVSHWAARSALSAHQRANMAGCRRNLAQGRPPGTLLPLDVQRRHIRSLMRSCTTCTHPDRDQIEADLLQGKLSLRTIGGRHGLTAPALHRHRTTHMDHPTVGDLLEPADQLDAWRRFDGSEWQRCPTPKAEDLIELHCRPASYRRPDYSIDLQRDSIPGGRTGFDGRGPGPQA